MTQPAVEEIHIWPQPKQWEFSKSPADITIFGGSAGGGKTYGMLLDALRHTSNPKYGAVIFRRTSPEITKEGGLWDDAGEVYPQFNATPIRTRLEWLFPSKAKIAFGHVEHNKDVLGWRSSQITALMFDQLESFTESQFWGLFSRNRSTSGIRPYTKATCNPDPDSWLAGFIAWWINQETGYAIPERSGLVRWLLRASDVLYWYDSQEEALADRERLGLADDTEPNSVTFIASYLDDNQALLEKDPGYRAKLMALPMVERERLLSGNWKIREGAGTMFKRHWFGVIDVVPAGGREVRYWDRAATEPRPGTDPDWTVGLKLRRVGDLYYVIDVARDRVSPMGVDRMIDNCAAADGTAVSIGIEQDPGQAGKAEAGAHIRRLAGYDIRAYPAIRDKVTRAKPASAQAEAGNIKLLRGPWNQALLNELEAFPEGRHDDQVDGLSGAFNVLSASVASAGVSVEPSRNSYVPDAIKRRQGLRRVY